MTKTLPLNRPQEPASDAVALTFALAHHEWLRLSEEPESWTDPNRQRALAAAFVRFHAAKLALAETTEAHSPTAVC